MFWTKKKRENTKRKIILGMIILQDENPFDLQVFCKDFKENYSKIINDPKGDGTSLVLKVDGEHIMIGHVTAPIPYADIEETAGYAYNWKTAIEDLKTHQSHLIFQL